MASPWSEWHRVHLGVETIARFVRAWETGDFAELVSMLTEDAVLTMPPWVYWLDGRDAVAATMQSRGT